MKIICAEKKKEKKSAESMETRKRDDNGDCLLEFGQYGEAQVRNCTGRRIHLQSKGINNFLIKEKKMLS